MGQTYMVRIGEIERERKKPNQKKRKIVHFLPEKDVRKGVSEAKIFMNSMHWIVSGDLVQK